MEVVTKSRMKPKVPEAPKVPVIEGESAPPGSSNSAAGASSPAVMDETAASGAQSTVPAKAKGDSSDIFGTNM